MNSALIVAIIFGFLTSLFSLLAYINARERFRLELFDKRWEIYKELHKFCSLVLQHGGLPNSDIAEEQVAMVTEFWDTAQRSFRGSGLHLTKALFGTEIQSLCDDLNGSFAFLASVNASNLDTDTWYQHITNIQKIVDDMPNKFDPYFGFGRHKKFSCWFFPK